MSNIEQLIDASKQMTALLEELKQSQKYETCTYHVIKDDQLVPWERFFLYRIEDQAQLVYATKDYVKGWLERRKINPELVFNYELLN